MLIRTLFIVNILLLVCANMFAQLAPNFSITDTEESTHNLYEDYLNNDKVVVIKLFFVNCPICKPYNAPFQDLYEEFGSGQEDVQFFLLSSKEWDNNEEVGEYRQEYELTFPGAGLDGGAYEATEPYRMGEFGAYFGDPVFIVIEPNGTVHYDVSGSGVSGTIEAVKSTVTDILNGNTGNDEQTSVSLSISHELNGSIPDYQFFIRSKDNHAEKYAVPQAFVYPSAEYPELSNPEIYVDITTIDHSFITTWDIFTIQRFLLNFESFNNYQKIISDVNGSGGVTAGDLLSIRKLILGQNETLPVGKSYIAVGENCLSDFLDCKSSFDLDPSQTSQSINFVILKYADVR